jgi:hypothetical protein
MNGRDYLATPLYTCYASLCLYLAVVSHGHCMRRCHCLATWVVLVLVVIWALHCRFVDLHCYRASGVVGMAGVVVRLCRHRALWPALYVVYVVSTVCVVVSVVVPLQGDDGSSSRGD